MERLIIPGTKISIGPPGSGIYKAKVRVKDSSGNFISKTDNNGYSTFYPNDWDEMKTMDKIKEAANNMIGDPITNSPGKLEYIGRTSDGLDIRIVKYPNYNNNIGNAFLNYE